MGSEIDTLVAPVLKPKHAVSAPDFRQSWLMGIAVLLMAGIGMARIVSTYHVFSQTTDEPAHVAAGMEWLERGTYTFEPLHPPLARVAVTLGPYLSGLRLKDNRGLWIEGNELFLARGQYLHNLFLARLGVLPFFLLATFLVWYWARERYGDWPALAATFLFTTSPVVLAHSGLATTDMAATATFTAALLAYVNFLERPTCSRSSVLGVAVALAILSKFSALVFLPACGITLLLSKRVIDPHTNESARSSVRTPWSRAVAVSSFVMILVVWAGYRFNVSSATDATARPHYTIDQLVGTEGALHNAAYAVAELPFVPATALFQGLAKVRYKETVGHKSYLLGHVRQTGWWYFFPVALAVKSTIPFLILVLTGIYCLGKSIWRSNRSWIDVAPVIAALTILLVCLPSRINIGVRHILPIYPLLAIIAGVGACRLWEVVKLKYVAAALILTLVAWQLTSSIGVHPNYLTYFNAFAGKHPERVLIDSDLDWGQDLLRLSAALQQRHVRQVSLAYAGSSRLDLTRFGLPAFQVLAPHQPATGWIAISLLQLKTGGLGLPDDSFSWLEAYTPVALVGQSIRLYYVPDHRQDQARPISNSQVQ
jgi:4-amino-4-deoxy-L-arabinose transferase-like glycosyltransferase